MTTQAPSIGQPLRSLGGLVEVRVEVATGAEGVTFGLWDTAEWDVDVWGSEDPSWLNITPYVEAARIDRGAARWGARYQAGSCRLTLDNTTGIFTPDSEVPSPFTLPFRPGRLIRVVAIPDPTDPTKHPLWTGRIEAVDGQFGDGYSPKVVVAGSDFMAAWAGFDPPMLGTPTGVQSTSERVAAALDRMDWPSALRFIEPGEHSMQTSHLAQSVLEECSKAAEAEGGAFYCDAAGKATFRARDWLTTNTRSTEIQGYIGYDEIPDNTLSHPLEQVTTSWELAEVANQVSFARVGGSAYTVDDTDSQTLHGVRSYRRFDFYNNADSQVEFLADRHLAISKDLRLRIRSAQISGVADPANDDLNRLLYAADFGDLVAVRMATGHGWEITRECQVVGIHHNITGGDWAVTFTLDDALTNFLEE